MKHQAMTRLQMIGILAFLGVAAAVLFPVLARNPPDGQRSTCQLNLKQISLGLKQYVQDYDEKFPITTTEQGWFGALQPYLKNEAIFRCPQEELRGKDNLTDYWFNRRLAGVEAKDVAASTSSLAFGDGEPSDDPNISLQLMPPLWITKQNSPARRHLEGAEYAYVDGHVKWLKPEQVTVDKPALDAPTFLIR